MNSKTVTIYYVHDPMCSWCWAYRPVLEKLRASLPDTVAWRNLLGGLAPDSDVPMPEETRNMIMGHWRRIRAELGTGFNFDFWTRCQPRRSTYPSCRAVIAAAIQDREEDMILAIQRAYYLRAMNPSDADTLVQLSRELSMDERGFASDFESEATDRELRTQIEQARTWGVSSLPALLLNSSGGISRLPLDYRDPKLTHNAVIAMLS